MMLQRYPIASYYILALAWTWIIELLLVAVKEGWIAPKVPFSIHCLAALGPAVASALVTAATSGLSGLKELLGRITSWRAGRLWVYVTIFSPLDMFAASKVAQDIIPMAMSAMVIIVALFITRTNKPWNFHHLEKKVLG